MKNVLSLYVLKRFMTQLALMLAALTGILLLFDLLANAEDITAENEQVFFPLIFYMMLRLPALISLIIPMSVLMASIMTFAKLASEREMIAMENAGVTLYRVLGVIMCGVIFVGALQFALNDVIGVKAADTLNKWESRNYTGLPEEEEAPHIPNWFTSDDYIVNIASASKDGHKLYDLVITGRDENKLLSEYYTASHADFEDTSWVLYDVYYKNLETAAEFQTKTMPFEMTVTPQRFSSFNKSVEALKFSELWLLGRNKAGAQNRPSYYYAVWFHYKITQPLGALVMVLMAAPLALILARRGGLVLGGTLAIASGFTFFITEKILLTLGENGQLPVFLAAWGPLIIFGMLASSVILYRQS